MVLAVAVSAAAAQTAYPVFTPEDFVRLMKSVGANWNGTSASIVKGDIEEAKSRLTRSREQLAVTITFWRDSKRADAVTMLRDTLTKLDELDAALSVEPVEKFDKTAAATLVTQVDGACGACHAVYRDQDPVSKAYRLKPGSLSGQSAKP